jgi:uncharacterized phage protein gp47/JayE
MPWVTPSLEQLRSQNRDNVTAQLRSGPMIPNSVLRVMADGNAGLGYLTLLYLNWLALQLLPDTAETEWLDRFGNIWVGGRKTSTYASGVAGFFGLYGVVIPSGSMMTAQTANGPIIFQTAAAITIGNSQSPVAINALTPGETLLIGGEPFSLVTAISGVNSISLMSLIDGIDGETDDELRVRVLDRIRQPPMGGDAFDYVEWALAQPGVTRAWCSPMEMGIGTCTLRFMMDDLRAYPSVSAVDGFPTIADAQSVYNAVNILRPVTVKDFFVVPPMPEPINFTVSGLNDNSSAMQAAIGTSVNAMLKSKAAPASSMNGQFVPAQTIYAAWVNDAIMNTPGVEYFDLQMVDHPMPYNGSMAVLGQITFL